MLMRILGVSGIVAGMFLNACNHATQEEARTGSPAEPDPQDYILVDGDMYIHKKEYANFMAGIGRGPEIPEHLDNPAFGPEYVPPLRKAAQRQMGTIVSASRIADVKVMLNAVPTEWVSHMDAAIAAFNQLSHSTAIRMRKVTSGADIVISVNTSGTSACGSAWGPTGGAPGSSVTIYTNHPHLKRNKALWTPLVIHELGHTLGLGHTNETGPHIPTTPLTQAASIMEGGTCANPASGLTASDHKALIYLYPPAETRPWMRWDDYANMDFIYSTNPTIPAIPDAGTFPLYVINVGLIYTAPSGGRVPVYRYYSASKKDHFYTNSLSEGNAAVASGLYVYEGITGYVGTSQTADNYPLIRFVNPSDGKHFYGTGAGPSGYVQEGPIMGYVKATLW